MDETATGQFFGKNGQCGQCSQYGQWSQCGDRQCGQSRRRGQCSQCGHQPMGPIQAMWPVQAIWPMGCSAGWRSRRGGTPACLSGLLYLLLILFLEASGKGVWRATARPENAFQVIEGAERTSLTNRDGNRRALAELCWRRSHGDWGRDAALWLGRRAGRLRLAELGRLAGGMEGNGVEWRGAKEWRMRPWPGR